MCISCRGRVAEYEIVGGDHLGCHFSSILHSTGLQYRDFIYVSFHNQVGISLVAPVRNTPYVQKCPSVSAACTCPNSLSNSKGSYVFSLLQIYEIPFYVALDHKREAVLVAVRGTLSLRVSWDSQRIPFL